MTHRDILKRRRQGLTRRQRKAVTAQLLTYAKICAWSHVYVDGVMLMEMALEYTAIGPAHLSSFAGVKVWP